MLKHAVGSIIFRYMNAKNLQIALLFILPGVMMTPLYSQSLRVMSYNIRYDNPADGPNAWGYRKEFLVEQVKKTNPDILGIQESLPNQVAYLASALPEYDHVGKGRDENGQGESTTIFYKKKRFDLKEDHQFWLSETPDTISKGWDAAIRRICTYALLYDKNTRRSFWIFNTHFDHVGREARVKSAELILNRIDNINNASLQVILLGDFNATPESEPIQKLSAGMQDARLMAKKRVAGPEGSFNAFDFAKPATTLIDHIFVTPDVAVKKYLVLVNARESRYPSDHFPVVVELTLTKGAR